MPDLYNKRLADANFALSNSFISVRNHLFCWRLLELGFYFVSTLFHRKSSVAFFMAFNVVINSF